MEVTTQKKGAPIQKKEVATQKKEVITQKKQAPIQKKEEITQKKEVTTQKKEAPIQIPQIPCNNRFDILTDLTTERSLSIKEDCKVLYMETRTQCYSAKRDILFLEDIDSKCCDAVFVKIVKRSAFHRNFNLK